jgi:hypothetical protein
MEMKKEVSRSSGMLSRLSRFSIGISALLLASAFLVPVWRIDLIAPQYPEGLGMLIRINTITGIKPADLNNINGLNHYIGMKAIVPDAIPVLDIMPIALAALVVLGIGVALWGRRWAAWTWLGLIAAGGAAAMAELRLRSQPGARRDHQDSRHDVPTATDRHEAAVELHSVIVAGHRWHCGGSRVCDRLGCAPASPAETERQQFST